MEVSIVIPARNAPTLKNCLAAVTAQRFSKACEVLVVENDSLPKLREVVAHFGVRYLQQPKGGSYHARQAGWQATEGEVVVFLDADCIPQPGWLEGLMTVLEDPEVAAVGGATVTGPAAGWVGRAQRQFLLHDGLQTLKPIYPAPYAPGGNMAIRRSVLLELGGFDTSFFSGGDVDISWRLQIAGHRLCYAPQAKAVFVPRDNWRLYFKQYYKYSLGQVVLFRKYRPITRRKLLINGYPFRGMAASLGKLVAVAPLRWLRGDKEYALRCLLGLTEHAALLAGAAVGSVRYRVFYL